MPLYRHQFTVLAASNIAADNATNTMYFRADNLNALVAVEAAAQAFYIELAAVMGDYVKAVDNVTFKAYDMANPEPRVPVRTGTFNVPEGNTLTLPTEVAMVLSFQAAKISGVPQARRRGRIYVPFIRGSLIGNDSRPLPGAITTLVTAGDNLLTASDAAATWKWVVYSPTTGADVVVSDGWVDNEYDTQRRRGRKATTRTTFT
jgi:hypothetical protein